MEMEVEVEVEVEDGRRKMDVVEENKKQGHSWLPVQPLEINM
jgi:hypothetical protein